MKPLDYIKKRMFLLESSLNELKGELERLESNAPIRQEIIKIVESPIISNSEIDVKRLLGDETYRITLAIGISKTLKDCADILGTCERTLYRKLRSNNIDYKKTKAKTIEK